MITLAFGFSNILTILLFVIIICGLIAWHELGHLLAAKKCNVYCYEYSIGFGPIIYKNKKHETHFCIRAIPLGGFVKMAGEEGVEDGEVIKGNNDEEIPSDRILSNKPLRKKALVLAAGGLMNMLLAVICFYFYVSCNKPYADSGKTGFVQMYYSNEVVISPNADDTPSMLQEKGMETGDRIVAIKTKLSTENSYKEFNNIKRFTKIQKALNSKIPTEIGQVQEIHITFEDVSNNNKLVEIDVSRKLKKVTNNDGKEVEELQKIGLAQKYKVHEYNGLTGIYGTFHFMGYYTAEVGRAFGRLFTGDFSGLSGLVGIYSTVDDVATDSNGIGFGQTLIHMIYLIGAISFSLGFFNLIPFPALDGGRLFFVGLEGIRKKKINPNVEATIHTVGLILLFVLMIVINIRDIFNLF